MRTPTLRQVGCSLVAVVVVIVLVLSGMRLNSERSQKKDASADPTGNSTTQAPAVSSGSTAPGFGSSKTAIPTSSPVRPDDPLNVLVQAFSVAFFEIQPSDTEINRRDRVAALNLATPETMQMLEFTLNPQEIQYQQQGLTQQAQVDSQTVTALLNEGTADSYTVSAPVVLEWVKDNQTVGSDVLYTVSTWQYRDNRWSISDFSTEGGG